MGVQQIMAQAMALVPEYNKLISKKIKSGSGGDVSDVETMFAENNLAAELVTQFSKASTVPAMICWLFFGRSFETMVENLERVVTDPTQNQSDKLFATQTIKLVIEQSIFRAYEHRRIGADTAILEIFPIITGWFVRSFHSSSFSFVVFFLGML